MVCLLHKKLAIACLNIEVLLRANHFTKFIQIDYTKYDETVTLQYHIQVIEVSVYYFVCLARYQILQGFRTIHVERSGIKWLLSSMQSGFPVQGCKAYSEI